MASRERAEQRAYQPIPTDEAKRLSEQYNKSIVIIFAHDPIFGCLHTTTYGRNEQEKHWAAQGGEIATRALGALPEAKTSFEDFRDKDRRAFANSEILRLAEEAEREADKQATRNGKLSWKEFAKWLSGKAEEDR